MLSPDVNILVNAFRADAPDHDLCSKWIAGVVDGASPFAIIPNVLSGFVRVVTHPCVFTNPSSLEEALSFCEVLLHTENAQIVGPGPGHWRRFSSLCREGNARGNLVPDAWFAAVAMENGCEWITLDRDYARFPGLRWRVPARGE